MRTIASRFVMLVATAAVAPLVLFGAVSVYSLRSSSRQSVIEENLQVAAQAAELIGQYMDHHLSVLQTTAAHLRDTQLEPQQQTQVLINHVIDYEVLRELTLFGPDGAVVATSRLGAPTVQPPPDQPRERSIAPVPSTTTCCRRRPSRCRSRRSPRRTGGWSARSASKSSGEWSPRSVSARRGTRW